MNDKIMFSNLLEDFEIVFNEKPVNKRLKYIIKRFGAKRIAGILSNLMQNYKPPIDPTIKNNPYGYIYVIAKSDRDFEEDFNVAESIANKEEIEDLYEQD